MIVDKLASEFRKFKSDLVLGTVMDAGDIYIVSLTRKSLPKDAYVMDTTYSYDKKNGRIKPFIVGQNSEKYKEGLKRIVYRKPR